MGFREHVDLQIEPDGDGRSRVVLDARDEHLNPHGAVHGGVLATMIDVAMGTAISSSGGQAPVTVSLTVTYLEPGHPGRLTATARLRKQGKRLTVVEAEVVQDGDVVADALATFATKPSD
jgi:uncharacterized protein (TIGR00369 family)